MKANSQQRIVAYIKAGKRPAEIAGLLGLSIATVYHYTAKARREGCPLPRAQGGPRAVGGEAFVTLKVTTVSALRPLAEARDLSLADFCNMLLNAVADGDLAPAILDEEAQTNA